MSASDPSLSLEAMLAAFLNDRIGADTVTPLFTDVRRQPLQSGPSSRPQDRQQRCRGWTHANVTLSATTSRLPRVLDIV
jgi:hypothetical protein